MLLARQWPLKISEEKKEKCLGKQYVVGIYHRPGANHLQRHALNACPLNAAGMKEHGHLVTSAISLNPHNSDLDVLIPIAPRKK